MQKQTLTPEDFGLVNIQDLEPRLLVDILYASKENFSKTILYSENKCFLREKTALKVVTANKKASDYGLSLKIKDGYRPFHVQEKLYNLIQDPNYVAKPIRDGDVLIKGSKHSRGASVDVVLVDRNQIEIEKPSEFDDFSERAHISYSGSNKTAHSNMLLLQKIMKDSGFESWPFEWWHFDDKDWEEYEMLDVPIG